ncbi:hypothetical protein HYW76_03690 [Candidatus Pacearchaeota archaeon]|nr:hypothetical protein [Candidatus Pacearchaeota archaeon]
MSLKNKKMLISRVLNVGVGRIKLNPNAKTEIEEAITRQDIRDLKEQGIIRIEEVSGRKIVEKRKKRRAGKIKKRVEGKDSYVVVTRKLRGYLKNLKSKGQISKEKYYDLRRKTKARTFKGLSHLKESI